MDRVRIGCVKYLNTLPLIQGLGSWRDCELIAAVPAKLIDMLHRRDVDIALASVIDAARSDPSLSVVLLPVGMIGCDGPTLTVRVFSRIPIDQVRRVAVDTDSHTSVALLRVLMFKRFGVRIDVVDFDARERMVVGDTSGEVAEWHSGKADGPNARTDAWPETVLLIGDKVVTDAPPASEYPHQMDLGAAWKELTGLPFVYATWMCRAGDEHSLKVRAAAMMLERARLHNRTRLDWIVATHARDRGWPVGLAAHYLGSSLKFDIQEPEREAVEKFLRWASELGLVANPRVEWAAPEMAKSR